MHAKFGAASFHGFGVMEEMDGLTDGQTDGHLLLLYIYILVGYAYTL